MNSPRSKPANAASTISLTFITISGGVLVRGELKEIAWNVFLDFILSRPFLELNGTFILRGRQNHSLILFRTCKSRACLSCVVRLCEILSPLSVLCIELILRLGHS